MELWKFMGTIFLTCFSSLWIELTFAVVKKFDNITKSFEDRRSYRGLILDNGLKVLLISDSDAKKAAASISVGIGSLDDTADVPGLANLVACMLMISGSVRNQLDGVDFQAFLMNHGGQLYPPKVLERLQNFTFDVKPSSLAEALDRFASIFISPMLSNPSILERCVEIMGKQYEHRSRKDNDRILEVEKCMSRKMYAYNHFYLGNLSALRRQVKTSPQSLIRKMEMFHSMWYSANIMSLVVLGTENLDQLETVVVPLFDSIKNNNARPIFYAFKHHPWSPEQLGHKIYVVSQTDIKLMRIIFPVPYDHASGAYVGHFLCRQGQDGLIFLLQSRGLCTDMRGDLGNHGGITFFRIICDLNTDSSPHDIDLVIRLLFQYLRLLNPDDLPVWIFEEFWRVQNLEILNSNPDYEEYIPFVRELSHNLQTHPMKQVLISNYVDEDGCRSSSIKQFLTHLRPDRMNVTIASHEFADIDVNRLEKYYGTSYAVEKLSEELIESCTEDVIPGLQLPRPNEFLAENFAIYPSNKSAPKHPYKLYESSKCEIWFKQDDEFRVPSLRIEFQLFCSSRQLGPFENALWGVLRDLLQNALERNFKYHADVAIAEWEMDLTDLGIHVKLYGYNDKLSILLEKILSLIINFKDNDEDFNANRFESSRYKYFKNLKTGVTQNLTFQTHLYTKHLQETVGWLADTLVHVGSLLKYDDMIKFLSKAFRRIFIQGFVYGNYTEQHAMEVVEILEKSFQSSSGLLLQEVMLRQRYIEIAPGSHSILQLWNKTGNYGYSSYFQLHTQPSMIKRVTAYLMSEIVSNSCMSLDKGNDKNKFSLISCFLLEMPGAQGIMIHLASIKNPRTLYKKLDAFFRDMNETLVTLPNSRLQKSKEAVQKIKYKRSPRQVALANTYWNEIKNRSHHFDNFEMEQEQLFSLKKQDLLLYFRETLGTKSSGRRLLVMQVFPIADMAKGESNVFMHAGVCTHMNTVPSY